MRARDIMSKSVCAVPSGTAAEEAWQLMRGEQIYHLLVGTAARPGVCCRPATSAVVTVPRCAEVTP
jgi:CBS-domain-containing membrane protein